MNNLFVKAYKQYPLTPMERAVLKFVQQTIVAAVSTLALALAYDLPSRTNIDWLFLIEVSLIVGVLTALLKYFSARGDTLVTQALTQVITDVEARANIPTQRPTPPPISVPPTPPQ